MRPSLEVAVIWALMAILTVFWLIGLAFDFAGLFANVPLVIVAALVTVELAKRMRATA
jgi:uncharacterized protein DUF5670